MKFKKTKKTKEMLTIWLKELSEASNVSSFDRKSVLGQFVKGVTQYWVNTKRSNTDLVLWWNC